MSKIPLLVKLSETEKRALIIIFIIVTFAFVLVGLVVKGIRGWMEKKGRAVDSYMYDLVKYKIITSPSDFKAYVAKRETRHLYLNSRWAFRILIVSVVAFIIFVNNYLNGDFQVCIDIISKLVPELTWPTTHMFGIEIISDWPTVTRPIEAVLSVEGYVSYIMGLILIYCVFKLTHDILLYISRISRANKASITAFGKNLDNGVDQIE